MRGREFLSRLRFDITQPLAPEPEDPAIVQHLSYDLQVPSILMQTNWLHEMATRASEMIRQLAYMLFTGAHTDT